MTSMSRLLPAYPSNSCQERGRIVSIARKNNVNVNIVTSMSRLRIRVLCDCPSNSCVEAQREVLVEG